MKSLHSAARVKRPNLQPSFSGFLLLTLLMIPLAAHAQSSPFDNAVDIAQIPHDDRQVYASLRKADTIGLFQVESRAQMASLPRNNPDSFTTW
jgi:DNA polymerase III alpha subunit